MTFAQHRYAPFLVAGLGIFLLSVMDAMIKGVATAHPTAQIVLMRYACGMPWAIAFFLWTRPSAPTYLYQRSVAPASTAMRRVIARGSTDSR